MNIKCVVTEYNREMKNSYVMIDPAGRFFNNQVGTHSYSRPILKVGMSSALMEMEYNYKAFKERGGEYNW